MSAPESAADAPQLPAAAVYNRQFWLAYVANFALVTANSLMYRFAEFIAYLHGNEKVVGAIVGTGLVGVLLVRLVLGQAIDRSGTRFVWVTSSVVFIFASLMFLACHSVSYGVYAARTIYSIAVAGMFTCSVVHVQNLVPVYRRTEAIGVLGTSGFLGTIAGVYLGDAIFAVFTPPSDARYIAFFLTAAALGAIYLAIVVFLRHDDHVAPQASPPALKLLLYYWPGGVVLVALALGTALSVTTVFLTRFATKNHIPELHTFFNVYCVVALVFRVPSTQWARTIGRHKTILIGLAGNIVGHAMLPFVTRDWQFLFPAAACGFGHALLYPAIVSLGSGAFPRRYRGVGTTVMLGCNDAGMAIAPPILGWIFDRFGDAAMFYSASAFGLAVAVYYGLTAARKPDNDVDPEPEVFFDENGESLIEAQQT